MLLVETAATDPACFAEEVLKDEQTGDHIILAPHQLEWFAHLDRCQEAGKFCGILAPPSSGKSQIFSVGYPDYCLGRDPNLRIRALMSSGTQAKKRISPAKDYIAEDEDFRRVFPNCRPSKGSWTDYEFNVRRRGGIKDPSYAAAGIEHPPIGARIDGLICDDVVTYENVIAEPAMREKAVGLFYNGYDTRLSPDSWVIYIGGVVSLNDLTSRVMSDDRFWFILQRISDDFESLIQEDLRTGEIKTFDLWKRAWNPDWLRKKHAANSRAFDRAYRHKGYSDSERMFELDAIRAAIKHVDDPAAVPEGAPSVCGMDLSEKTRKGSVIVTAARVGAKRIVRDVQAGAWDGGEKARRLIAVKNRFGTLVEVVENNALQASIIDLINVVSERPLNIQPFRTGKQKADEELGIPALAAEFANGLWEIRFPHGHTVGMGCECDPCRLVGELEEYPFGTTDCVMALWFARHGLVQFGSASDMEWNDPATKRLSKMTRGSRLAKFREMRRKRS